MNDYTEVETCVEVSIDHIFWSFKNWFKSFLKSFYASGIWASDKLSSCMLFEGKQTS